ncbi:MAG: Inorganic pyrophosphatase [Bacillota bacterium]|nr:Inorganic pyrophosphatase [Bacillota bacterium]
MMELENNALFWQKLDTILLSSSIVLDFPKGSHHPIFTALTYPVDFAHLEDSFENNNNKKIHVYKGSDGQKVVGIVISADVLEKDCFVTVLVGCNEQERHDVLEFMNQMECQKCIYVTRGDGIPVWSNND